MSSDVFDPVLGGWVIEDRRGEEAGERTPANKASRLCMQGRGLVSWSLDIFGLIIVSTLTLEWAYLYGTSASTAAAAAAAAAASR